MRLISKYKNINFYEIIQSMYEDELLISNWNYADYYSNRRYILNMPFINTEVLNKIKWYYSTNKEKHNKLDIITLEENKDKINEILNGKCNIKTFNKELLGGQDIEFEKFEEGI